MSSIQQICILSIICLVPRNSHCECLGCCTAQRLAWVTLYLGDERRQGDDNIILQTSFIWRNFFCRPKKGGFTVFVVYCRFFCLMVNVHNTRIGLGTHTFSTHVCTKLTVRVRLKKKNQSSQETHEDVCSPPLSVCYWDEKVKERKILKKRKQLR